MTNFVFSRRAMQARITDLAQTLDNAQLRSLINRLNANDATRLHAMWELVILHGLSQVGDLKHEQVLPNGRCPDIDWKIKKQDCDILSIIADITTISDDGLEAQNPIRFLREEIFRVAIKLGLLPGNFWCDVRGKTIGPSHKSKMRLMMPEKPEISSFINNELEPWFYNIKKNRTIKSTFERTEKDLNFKIIYDPAWENGGGSHTSYTVATSKTINPLFSALKGKVKQLNGAPDDALRLIIACDGGCDLLRHGAGGKSHCTYNSREVAEDFLRQNSSIDFVLLTTIAELRQSFGLSTNYQMSYELVCAPPASRSQRVTLNSINSVTEALGVALSNIPKPLRPAYHSASLLKQPGVGNDQLGGYSMQGHEIKISSRGLIRLLAGEISVEEFNRAHRWNEPNSPNNPFSAHLKSRLMISKIDVTAGKDTDDDEITFTLDKFDAANTNFSMPNTDETNKT